MPTNIGLLPQLSDSFVVATNGDWRDQIVFVNNGAPLDITGIRFKGQLRSAASDFIIRLIVSTDDGTLVNGGSNGSLTFAVPYSLLQPIPPGAYVFDLLAMADNETVNLFQAAPAQVTVNEGVTR